MEFYFHCNSLFMITICSITLHVNCKLAVFVNFQVLTMTKMDTKVKNQVLTNILHCSVDRKMVLRAQKLAPSGIMLIILSLKCKYLQAKRSFRIWHLNGSGQDLKILLKSKIPTCNLPLFLILHTYMYYNCPKSMEMTSPP